MSTADTSPRAWPRRAALALVWLALVLMGGIFVHSAEVDHRASLEKLFGARAENRAQFVQAFAQDVFQHNEAFATSV